MAWSKLRWFCPELYCILNTWNESDTEPILLSRTYETSRWIALSSIIAQDDFWVKLQINCLAPILITSAVLFNCKIWSNHFPLLVGPFISSGPLWLWSLHCYRYAPGSKHLVPKLGWHQQNYVPDSKLLHQKEHGIKPPWTVNCPMVTHRVQPCPMLLGSSRPTHVKLLGKINWWYLFNNTSIYSIVGIAGRLFLRRGKWTASLVKLDLLPQCRITFVGDATDSDWQQMETSK